MSKKIISRISGGFVHDASSVHGLIPNVSTYTLQIGDPSSSRSTTSVIGLPSDVMLRSEGSGTYSMAGHVHDVSYNSATDEGGQVTPTGTVSKPTITPNNTTSSISYISDCSATATTTAAASGDIIKTWVYNAANESLSFTLGNIQVNVTTSTNSLTAITDATPELSEAPTFTGNELPAHTHTFKVKTYTGKDSSNN